MAIEAIWWMLLTLTISTCLVPAYTMGNWEHPQEMEALQTFKMYSWGLSFDPNHELGWDFSLRNPCTWNYITCNSENKTTALIILNKNLSGKLVPELGQLSALERLALPQNRLTGTIPQELGNLKKLVYLRLSGNQLSGSIPTSLGNLKSVHTLLLDNNMLTGKVPSGISKIPALRSADFSNNKNLCWDFWPTPVFKGSYPLCQKK